ncbi:alpha/beta hydrolase family protein [Streptomyces hawaiiensis]|uniref:hypothetical protein n=1 Tax=Streptomyces hawaiiensis TaxID=67305 RepID=UPI003655519B
MAALLDAMVGEPYQPPQPAGPIDAALLAAAAVAAEEAFTGLRDARALVVAADREDRDYAHRTGLAVREIGHEPTKWAPSWHWSYEPRRAVLDAVLGFVREVLADPAPRELPKSGPPPAVAETVPGPRGDRISSLNFTSGGEHLLGILPEPGPRPGGAPHPVCLIYEPGNPGQRVDIHECGPALAHAGAAHGVPVFRYDSRGMGISDGSFTHSTWSRDGAVVQQPQVVASAVVTVVGDALRAAGTAGPGAARPEDNGRTMLAETARDPTWERCGTRYEDLTADGQVHVDYMPPLGEPWFEGDDDPDYNPICSCPRVPKQFCMECAGCAALRAVHRPARLAPLRN